MDTMTSTEFRKTYATLTEPTIVTALGRPIGVWTPGLEITTRVDAGRDWAETPDGRAAIASDLDKGLKRAADYYGVQLVGTSVSTEEVPSHSPDLVSHRMTASFNSRPFRPVPKGK